MSPVPVVRRMFGVEDIYHGDWTVLRNRQSVGQRQVQVASGQNIQVVGQGGVVMKNQIEGPRQSDGGKKSQTSWTGSATLEI